ncbi:TPA: DUF4279 domain-containing protein [Providencia stuartii]|uniref:DUF4279 domain-containing protein n=1 Tax=Providencia stuartii TaxID=588 RepID=UPI000536DE96|nr:MULTISPECIES: DUF4279 domain-containing protein [Providencia]AXO18546.1 DUF4279 domain-containing protein [Providencia stuartii]MBN5560546.1 DUF4279 domain-containing protein [Providencia stuartii]MBN5593728.1 DUF4279 domain-containing protein [Providencia stuartii]MBN5603033.1 DUF4279 domain-containing protein [Providencia stuartii]MBN5607049.1 DUF4279 domain-containing protein [Providencia stuartii]
MTKTTVQAEFSISGDEKLDIVKITEMLNINPSKAAVKGERNLNVKREFYHPTSYWIVRTDKEKSYDVEIQTKKILEKFSDKKNELIKIKELYNASISLCLFIEIVDNEKPAIGWSAETNLFLGSIGAESFLDLYIY